ncbi:hypothetical protein AVEN_108649-1 [Araneus ventricosus]|uniref:Uncharacterized protein n=1 Tax=Araneus ventricosus TaxID=182803 RepID=A0A4Y2IQH2_ARAVE|nr:hypothetical protein AVEN_108649-1 [Araneus ventricosus]
MGPQHYPDNGLVSGTRGEVSRNQEAEVSAASIGHALFLTFGVGDGTCQDTNVLGEELQALNILRLTNKYVVTDVLFRDVSGCIGHNGAATSTTILSLPGS